MQSGAFILAIDLDPVVRAALAQARVPVRVVASPYELIVVAATLWPMLVIVDRTTNDPAAIASLEALDSSHFRRVPVAIFSGEDEPGADEEAGVFILRPRDMTGLLGLVRRMERATLVLH